MLGMSVKMRVADDEYSESVETPERIAPQPEAPYALTGERLAPRIETLNSNGRLNYPNPGTAQ